MQISITVIGFLPFYYFCRKIIKIGRVDRVYTLKYQEIDVQIGIFGC